jgi:deoxyribonuclease-4
LDALELQFVRNVQFDPRKAAEARAEAEHRDVLLSAHAPYYVNLNSASTATREKSEEWVLRTMRAATAYGAWVVVVHAAVYGEGGAERATARVADSLQRVRRRAEEETLTPLIGLETMGRRSAWGTTEEIMEVMEMVEGTLPVLDFAHLQARDPGLTRGSLLDLLSSLPEVPLLHCHLSGIEFTAAGERRHLRLGEGLDHVMVLSALVESGREATVICESTSPMEDALAIRRVLDQAIWTH